ncbi:MAG: 2'-5' RNA ligase family protein, partial [Chitinophagaceae bacterium]
MKSIIQSIPGYRINEYMIVLHPPQDLRDKIGNIKKEFSDTYQTSVTTAGKSHILLAAFTQYAMMEERVVNRLNAVAMGYRPFKVELKDYGSYPTHSVFIQVTTKDPVRKLVREIKDFQQLLRLNKEHKPHFIDEPVITIARKLLPWQYEKGWHDLSHRQFTGRFIADSM